MGTYIFDIDGTLANAEHRLHYIKAERSKDRDWPSFFKEAGGDTPIKPTVELCCELHQSHYIVLITGRPERNRRMTESWLLHHHVGYDDLLMRPDNDSRTDSIVKQELFEASVIVPERVLGVFEDRDRVVKMWRDLGLICYQVCEGDY